MYRYKPKATTRWLAVWKDASNFSPEERLDGFNQIGQEMENPKLIKEFIDPNSINGFN